jgi:hypothetical protein
MKTVVKKSKNISITIPQSIIKEEDFVVVPRKEYERMRTSMVPTFYLKGKAARDLDNRVTEALKEHRGRKTVRINSLADLM